MPERRESNRDAQRGQRLADPAGAAHKARSSAMPATAVGSRERQIDQRIDQAPPGKSVAHDAPRPRAARKPH